MEPLQDFHLTLEAKCAELEQKGKYSIQNSKPIIKEINTFIEANKQLIKEHRGDTNLGSSLGKLQSSLNTNLGEKSDKVEKILQKYFPSSVNNTAVSSEDDIPRSLPPELHDAIFNFIDIGGQKQMSKVNKRWLEPHFNQLFERELKELNTLTDFVLDTTITGYYDPRRDAAKLRIEKFLIPQYANLQEALANSTTKLKDIANNLFKLFDNLNMPILEILNDSELKTYTSILLEKLDKQIAELDQRASKPAFEEFDKEKLNTLQNYKALFSEERMQQRLVDFVAMIFVRRFFTTAVKEENQETLSRIAAFLASSRIRLTQAENIIADSLKEISRPDLRHDTICCALTLLVRDNDLSRPDVSQKFKALLEELDDLKVKTREFKLEQKKRYKQEAEETFELYDNSATISEETKSWRDTFNEHYETTKTALYVLKSDLKSFFTYRSHRFAINRAADRVERFFVYGGTTPGDIAYHIPGQYALIQELMKKDHVDLAAQVALTHHDPEGQMWLLAEIATHNITNTAHQIQDWFEQHKAF